MEPMAMTQKLLGYVRRFVWSARHSGIDTACRVAKQEATQAFAAACDMVPLYQHDRAIRVAISSVHELLLGLPATVSVTLTNAERWDRVPDRWGCNKEAGGIKWATTKELARRCVDIGIAEVDDGIH